jgi:hypothetical protein
MSYLVVGAEKVYTKLRNNRAIMIDNNNQEIELRGELHIK